MPDVRVYVRKQYGTWRAVARQGGRDVSKSTGIPCNSDDNSGKQKALRIAREWATTLADDDVFKGGIKETRPIADYIQQREESRMRSGVIERSTYQGYTTYFNYLREYFGDKTIAELTTEDAEGYLLWLTNDKKVRRNTVKKAYNVLKAGVNHAVKSRLIEWSPLAPLDAPKQDRMDPNPLTQDSMRLLAARLDGLALTQCVTATHIAYNTGMRRGEVCGLRWSEVRLEGGSPMIRVSRSIGSSSGGSYEKSTKTNRERMVPVTSKLRDVLLRRRGAMLEECMACGVPFSPDMYVCGSVDGKWLGVSRLSKWWHEHATEWGLMGTQGRVPTFHDLRHTYATVAVRTVDPKTAQDIMGHSNISMTMSYADTDMEQVAAAAKPMGDALSVEGGEVLPLRKAN